jgi:Zn-dependent peptidase ImmA (M78 family)/DNA-binding XRE family transcriptional regulator
MTTALISPVVLHWARERARLDPERLAEKAHVNPGKLLLWEQGETKPTFKQALDLANALHIPFGFLFLPQPPEETWPIPDLRTVGDHATDSLSVDLRDVLADVLRKQDWYRDYLLEQGAEPLSFIGRFDLNAPATDIIADLMATLDLRCADREEVKNSEAFLSLLVEKAEAVGVWVMRSGIVGNNTHRILNVQEFRGFAICDDIAPVVFINGKDAKAAQIFTLVHELAHLWIGQSGISNLSLAEPANASHRRTEQLCNAVAAEVLAPRQILCERWNAQESVDENAVRLVNILRVSSVVVARRAFDLGLIEWPAYSEYYQRQVKRWRQEKKGSGGGDPYRTIPVRNGRRFTEAVVHSAFARSLLLRDAGKLIGVNPAKMSRLAQEIGIE